VYEDKLDVNSPVRQAVRATATFISEQPKSYFGHPSRPFTRQRPAAGPYVDCIGNNTSPADQAATARSGGISDWLKSQWAPLTGGGLGGVLITDLTGHVEARVALGILALSALITIARTIVSIVKIRTSRNAMTRMAEALSKLAKQQPMLATSLFMQLQAGDRAEGLEHGELSDMLRRVMVAELDEDTSLASPVSLVHGPVNIQGSDSPTPGAAPSPKPAAQNTAAS
jgi:hypothetical protein